MANVNVNNLLNKLTHTAIPDNNNNNNRNRNKILINCTYNIVENLSSPYSIQHNHCHGYTKQPGRPCDNRSRPSGVVVVVVVVIQSSGYTMYSRHTTTPKLITTGCLTCLGQGNAMKSTQ